MELFYEKITQVIPSHFHNTVTFPYSLRVFDSYVFWDRVDELENDEIVYDGRKEQQMSDKYVVSQEFMNTLNLWRENLPSFSMSKKFVRPTAIQELDDDIDEWWNNIDLSDEENNNRLIAIIRWVNGEDVFEVEKPKKWIVRSKETDDGGHHGYVLTGKHGIAFNRYYINDATRFDTKEEAESWANAHQEVIEVEAE